MHCHQLIGNWKQDKGAAGEAGKLTDDNAYVIAGKRDIFFGKIQDRDTASRVKRQKSDSRIGKLL
jgi:uncharacterized protein YjbJ (UPF0337 family)